MPCYAVAQTPEARQTPRLGFLTFRVYGDIYVCAIHPKFPPQQGEIGTPRAQFV